MLCDLLDIKGSQINSPDKCKTWIQEIAAQPSVTMNNMSATTVGLRPVIGLGPSTTPALDITIQAIAPEGLDPFEPLWKLLCGFIKRQVNIDITAITKKALIAFGAAVGIRFVFAYAKPLFVEYFTSSITLPIEHKTARGIRKWLDSHGCGHLNRHVKYTVEQGQFNMVIQTNDFVGEKRTAITGGLFLFENHPLYVLF